MKTTILIAATYILLLGACAPADDTVPAPEKPSLILPVQDELCTTGEVLSDTESLITFQWNLSANTDSYELFLKDLISGVVRSYTAEKNQLSVKLNRGKPYSWYVVSKSTESTETAKSLTWKFYNSGKGVVSYAPFPAEAVSPLFGQSITISENTVSLEWKGADVDNDIIYYDLYFGTDPNPPLLKAGLKESSFNVQSIAPDKTYYWKVLSYDSAGNNSDSGLFEFRAK